MLTVEENYQSFFSFSTSAIESVYVEPFAHLAPVYLVIPELSGLLGTDVCRREFLASTRS